MKKVILLALFMPFMAYGQILESFESQDLTKWVFYPAGRWSADPVEPLAGQYSLHHVYDNPDAGIDRAGISLKNLHPGDGVTRWSFMLRHGYDPSSMNNWSVFLMSDSDPGSMSADGNTRGYAVGVNLTGSDDTLRIWKVDRNVVSVVVSSGINWQTNIGSLSAARIVIERSVSGFWSMSVYKLDGTLVNSATGSDSELFSCNWLGIVYRYSSTRDRLLWFDDLSVEGVFYTDQTAPSVTDLKISGSNSVDVTLSEEPEQAFLMASNFKIGPQENTSSSCVKISGLKYRITFPAGFINKTINTLTISNICDIAGNCISDKKLSFTPFWAERGDVIITEIMADPVPGVNLPEKEYIEIFNRTQYTLNLAGWKLESGDQEAQFPYATIDPQQFRIICSEKDTSGFKRFGQVTGLPQFFSLTDGGKILTLADSSGVLIHGVEYSSEWYNDQLKSEGGWSLEMIDTSYPFFSDANWTSSQSFKGGSPGSVNSVSRFNKDDFFNGIENVFASDSITVSLRFSEPVFDLKCDDIILSGKTSAIEYLLPVDPLYREYSVKLKEPLSKRKIHEIEANEKMSDFAGNRIEKRLFEFGLTEEPERGDLLFNELMFNPLPGDQDYIELYNNSDKIIDASRILLVSVDDAIRDTSRIYQLSAERRCILPGTYFAITTNRKRILERYPESDPEHVFEIPYLPSMSDDAGHLVLLNRQLDKIDEVYYNQKMHYSLLSGYEGIALEKSDPAGNSALAVNWHSASESSGWGTPGKENSVYVSIPVTTDRIVLSSTRITPDGDGNDDLLSIQMNLTGNGNVISVSVFDENGSFVKKITDNFLAGPQASLIWDATADDGTPVGSGIYIILIRLFDDAGKTEQWKKICVVLRN
jgi:hypothetical protein